MHRLLELPLQDAKILNAAHFWQATFLLHLNDIHSALSHINQCLNVNAPPVRLLKIKILISMQNIAEATTLYNQITSEEWGKIENSDTEKQALDSILSAQSHSFSY